MSATHAGQSNATATPVLCLALEPNWNSWKLASTVGLGQKARLRTIPARNTDLRLREIEGQGPLRAPRRRAGRRRQRYEAGRDGFWLHRYLVHHGIDNRVVDSASVAVNRRRRRAKSDALDATEIADINI